jgi:hypothetical protein
MNITRRSFITKTLLALSSAVPNVTYANQQFKSNRLTENSKFQQECFIIYQEWQRLEENTPLEFLTHSISNNVSNRIKISELTKIDFQNQNFFTINGLLLGKTEAAFLALLGSNINN